MRRANVGAIALTIASIFASAGISCAEAVPEAQPINDVPLPAYEARSRELFDDGIEPTAVGYAVNDDADAIGDRPLRDRVNAADAVARVRVVTITSEQRASDPQWQIGLHSIEALAGRRALPDDFTIQVGMQDPAAGMVKASESRMVGMTFVAFVRQFATPSEGGQLHFHLAGDTKDEARAIREAALLSRIR